MVIKHLIDKGRVRRLPKQFSWIDQRLISDDHLRNCEPLALALYLFLVIVGDHQGLSYYADTTIANHIGFDQRALQHTRQQLIQQQLIAYQPPLYQVLALPDQPIAPANPPVKPSPRARQSGPTQLKTLLAELQQRSVRND
jgi:hypothetical protein|tara:strand:- start:2481 stop:2903 length:423 start_codon:yes stop_codon:yes gene_type:complete